MSFYCFGSHQHGCSDIMWNHFIKPTKIYFFPNGGIWPPPPGMQHENTCIKNNETYLLSRLFCSASARSIDLTIFDFPIKSSKYFYKIRKIGYCNQKAGICSCTTCININKWTFFQFASLYIIRFFLPCFCKTIFLLSYQRVIYPNRKIRLKVNLNLLLSMLRIEFLSTVLYKMSESWISESHLPCCRHK